MVGVMRCYDVMIQVMKCYNLGYNKVCNLLIIKHI